MSERPETLKIRTPGCGASQPDQQSQSCVSDAWSQFLKQTLADAQNQGLLRTRKVSHPNHNGSCPQNDSQNGSTYTNFASNDYLGLSQHIKVAQRATEALIECGVGSGASPLVSGYTDLHAELEKTLAAFNQTEDAVVFSSGYGCNSGVIASLVGPQDVLLSDRLNHASLIDGSRLSGAKTIVFPHANVDFVRDYLASERQNFRRAMILTESVFSMDGDLAPLEELAAIGLRYDAGLVVDEAHATGIYGPTGAGLVEELGMSQQILAKLGTLSKAIGCVGGYIAGSHSLCDFIVNRCRSYIYSTAIPGSLAAASTSAIEQILEMGSDRMRLRTLSRSLRGSLRERGWHVPDGDSPIIPIIVGDANRAVHISTQLRTSGCLVPAIRPPTVPIGTARLRISLSVRHDSDSIDRLLQALDLAGQKSIDP